MLAHTSNYQVHAFGVICKQVAVICKQYLQAARSVPA